MYFLSFLYARDSVTEVVYEIFYCENALSLELSLPAFYTGIGVLMVMSVLSISLSCWFPASIMKPPSFVIL